MVLTLNLISLISRKALVPFEFDVHLRAALHKAVEIREGENKFIWRWESSTSDVAVPSITSDSRRRKQKDNKAEC